MIKGHCSATSMPLNSGVDARETAATTERGRPFSLLIAITMRHAERRGRAQTGYGQAGGISPDRYSHRRIPMADSSHLKAPGRRARGRAYSLANLQGQRAD